jgi:hypothetical protein
MRVDGRHSRWIRGFFLAGCALALGCGDGGSSAAPVTLQAMSDAECVWRTRCNLGSCNPKSCSAAIYRADALAAAVRCFEKLTCEGRDDDCQLAALETATSDPETVIDSCIQRYRTSCPQYSDIDESLCIVYPLLVPAKQTEFNQCFDQGTCAEQCLQAVAALCTS